MMGFGERVQRSVFECELDDAALARMLQKARAAINEHEDGVCIYRLCAACRRERTAYGVRQIAEQPDLFIV